MGFTDVYRDVTDRLSYSDDHHYEHPEAFNGAFDVLKTRGSRLRQRIIAGSVISAILIGLFLVISPPEALPATLKSNSESITKWWKSGDKTNDLPTCEAIPETVQVSILETVGAHDEVDAALVHSLASQSNVNLTLYQMNPRFGSGKIIQAFSLAGNLTGPRHPDEFMSKKTGGMVPDILVVTTCEFGMEHAPKRLEDILEQGITRLVCVVHHSDHWAISERETWARPWVERDMIEFWTLSTHTGTFLRNVTENWNTSTPATIRTFVPVFPITSTNTSVSSEDDVSFAIQGNYDPERRDYKHIFQRLGNFLDDANGEQNVSLRLLGQGRRPKVPKKVKEYVHFDEGLSYTDFYGILSRSAALLPGFSSKEYLDRKASSSVPAALIAGTPIVATQAVLDAYSYVDADSAWLQSDTESDFDVVSRIMAASPKERAMKNANARANGNLIIQQNTIKVGNWVQEALYGIYCKSDDTE